MMILQLLLIYLQQWSLPSTGQKKSTTAQRLLSPRVPLVALAWMRSKRARRNAVSAIVPAGVSIPVVFLDGDGDAPLLPATDGAPGGHHGVE